MSDRSVVPNHVHSISPHVRALFPKFLANRAKDVERIREALERNDYATISLLGHSMRGNGASYGVPRVSTIGTHIEEAADAKDASGVRAYVDELEVCVEELRAAEGRVVD